MKNICLYLFVLFSILAVPGCTKTSFLDAKPNTNIVIPSTLTDLRALLNNTYVFSYSPGIGEVSADNYYLEPDDWNALSALEHNLYIWEKNLYGAQRQLDDWSIPNQQILYTNIVLEQWEKIHPLSRDTVEWRDIKGAALFLRAYAMAHLIFHFAPAYDSTSAGTLDGIPIRLSTDIHTIKQRSKLQVCIDQTIADTRESLQWLQNAIPLREKNRPSRTAAYALLSRIYLACRQYDLAGKMADSALMLYHKLIDYNTIDTRTNTPFDRYNEESIYFSQSMPTLEVAVTYSNVVFADTNVYKSYSSNDLRQQIYFRSISGSPGKIGFKSGYSGTILLFTGLTTDELYLNRAEAFAKVGNTSAALNDLNHLLSKRWKMGFYIPYQANSVQETLLLIRQERRKELIWRGLRWIDLKRYNQEGANITLTRQLTPNSYTLSPNDPRYIFPFPDDEITLSGIAQNLR
ncbi:RagB/SusD family nutrient uptake outer membrane protein [Asinibacterium sp. OR53]|uniref:RagB/SusD family nutrient uptake outer membrane protein n=1 Tax=Asinibacterium sp. OR53 TaxID=925409 RepID=UPI00047D9A2B|nr:RagB/SusD family nutrient uptake outer membrane protein [Asinibacterium sp. OR53]